MRSAMIGILGLALVLLVGCEDIISGPRRMPKEKKFTVRTSGPVTIERGGTATLTLTITRTEGFQEPITATFRPLPGGVELVSGDTTITGSEVTFTFKASDKASRARGVQIPIFLKSETGGRVTAPFGLTVTPKPGEEEPEQGAAEGEEEAVTTPEE